MCGSMADIHSATAEIRRGKKEIHRSKISHPHLLATQGGHNLNVGQCPT